MPWNKKNLIVGFLVAALFTACVSKNLETTKTNDRVFD